MTTQLITPKQENRLADLFRDAVRALGFTKEEAQEIIKNGGTMQEEIKPILKKLAMPDKRFGSVIKEFEVTVPADYNHDTQIDQFAERVKKLRTTYYYNDDFTSQNFVKATTRLEPGKTYQVKIFPILARVGSEDCLAFLRRQHATMVGGQGLTLVYDQKKEELPIGKWTVSFDKKEALWKDAGGHHRVPSVRAFSDGGFEFSLGVFEFVWCGGHCLLCFCDK